ncbi:hypothetical protein HNQ92_003192 [Rhabdobacter roseus]|uniref:Uncharacterized protein n=1 Tax=Rhabdobacter roseus TaxID=1655419 RepID=A0A840TNV9_9BACT|nr:hypothetical protein [Rhabdobacter roseus]MBB5285044.1 hypothetical protein [Rhabdobacter roseus]
MLKIRNEQVDPSSSFYLTLVFTLGFTLAIRAFLNFDLHGTAVDRSCDVCASYLCGGAYTLDASYGSAAADDVDKGLSAVDNPPLDADPFGLTS